MSEPHSDGLWLHLAQGRYRLADDVDPVPLLHALRGTDGLVVDVTDESGAAGVAVLRAGADPVVLLGWRAPRDPSDIGPNAHD